MLKKILTAGLALTLMFAVTACGSKDSDSKKTNDNKTTETKKERPFTESKGLIKYFTIDGEKIPLPETVGEYVKYLEKLGKKVELGDTGKSIYDAPDLDAGGLSSMVAYLKVYLDDSEWQWFGIRYENDTKKTLPIADCKVTQITLDYDTIAEEENHFGIKSIVFVTRNGDMPMDGKTSSHRNINKFMGPAEQNTDGHLHYTDDQKYKYELVTENPKGILTRVVIKYPVEG